MSEEWKREIARNLDRELEARGLSSSEKARSAYYRQLRQLFGWLREMAQEVQKKSLNPGAVIVVEEKECLLISIGTEILRLRAKPYPFCARGWGKVGISATSPIPFNEIELWSRGEGYVWLYGTKAADSLFDSGLSLDREAVEFLFRQAFRKYLERS